MSDTFCLQIHDFIKGLGLDRFGPEGMPEDDGSPADEEDIETDKPFKAKKSAIIKPVGGKEVKSKKLPAKQSEEVHEKLNKKTPFDKNQKKDFKNKKHGDLSADLTVNGTKIDLTKPPQNKKVVFDKELLNESKKQGDQPLSISTGAPQNKKIVFDESYIVGDQAIPDKTKDEDWYNLLIRPDSAWYQQGKKLKSDGSEPSPDDVRKCEAEGKRYLEEDTANFMKGIFFVIVYNQGQLLIYFISSASCWTGQI